MHKLFGFVTMLFAIYSCAAQPSQKIFDQPADAHPELERLLTSKVKQMNGVKYFGNGKLENRDGVTILHLKGSQYEMGFQHGVLLKQIIRENIREKLPKVRQNLDIVNKRLEELKPELLEELKGIAAGAGVDLKYLFATELINFEGDSGVGCSNAVMFGRSTKDGRLLHIRTFDFPERKIFNSQILCFYNPNKGIPFMGIILPGTVRLDSGINRKMVSLCVDIIPPSRSVRGGCVDSYLARYILQFANDIDEVSEIIMSARSTHYLYLFTVADGKKSSGGVFEMYSYKKRFFREPQDGYIIATNHFINKVTQKPFQDSVERYDYYDALIRKTYGQIDSTICLSFLKGYAKFRDGTNSRKSNNIHSFVFDPKDGKVLVSLKPPFPACKNRFYTYNLIEELN